MQSLQGFSTSNLLDWSKQIADGMDFLSVHKIVHRDLAARNVLLCDENLVKVSDFGLAKDVHKYRHSEYRRVSEKRLPFKWMAPESLAKKPHFSSASDVWSYGVKNVFKLYLFISILKKSYHIFRCYDLGIVYVRS